MDPPVFPMLYIGIDRGNKNLQVVMSQSKGIRGAFWTRPDLCVEYCMWCWGEASLECTIYMKDAPEGGDTFRYYSCDDCVDEHDHRFYMHLSRMNWIEECVNSSLHK